MDVTEPLLNRTKALLTCTKYTYEQIASGAGVKTDWLAKFAQGHIVEPGVSKVQRVHDFLIGREPVSNSH
jgi:transcriptional regulator with XRE-family HTH domain